MTVDWLFALLFSLGGIHIAVLASLVGMRKGAELLWWLAIASAMGTAAAWFDISSPFWTVLVGCLLAGTWAGILETIWMKDFRKNNPWYRPAQTRPREAGSLLSFSLAAAGITGATLGAVAWAVQAL